ncbi:hypothetical protein [Pandoraea anhela]|uniref:hypothetical protein n=1 Tax=Pandoraea anhela TaxID=2508295 RepID=UPI001240C9E5|nr:hypothetical protein [Pandoraea anhela]
MPLGLFVHGGKYIRVNNTGNRLSVFPPHEAQQLGLPPTPRLHQRIRGDIAQELLSPAAQPPTSAPETPLLSQGDAAWLVPLRLSHLVPDIGFTKSLFGVRMPEQPSTVVVQLEKHWFYASRGFAQRSGTHAFDRLDPDVPDDKLLIDRFLELKQHLKTHSPQLRRTANFRNVERQLDASQPPTRRPRPASWTADEAMKIFTSEKAQRAFVAANKASMASRSRFDAKRDEFDLAVYRTLLGPDMVFETDGEWNIGNTAGVADLKSRLRECNFAFASVLTPYGRKVYFSLSGGARAAGLSLAIHDKMGEAEEVTIGPVAFIDAKRRLARFRHESPDSPSKTALQVNLPVLDPACSSNVDHVNDAEQIIATVVARDARTVPLIGGIHFNTLLDTCDSCASTLALLQTQTQRPVSVIYHRDYGVTTANSRDRTILAIQQVAKAINDLHAGRMTGNVAEMVAVARKLPVPPLVASLSNALLRFDGSFTDAAYLGLISNACYLRLLGVLARNEVIETTAVVDMLLSAQGRAYVSLLATRVATHPLLARAWASLLHELKAAGAQRAALLRVLLSKPDGSGRCFYVELLRAPHAPGDARNALLAWLKSAGLVPRPRELPAYVSLMRTCKLSLRLLLQADSVSALSFEHVTLDALLREARESLSLTALDTADNARLAQRMRESMPTIRIAEQRAFREMVEQQVQAAWKDVLPESTAPSYIAKDIIEQYGPDYGAALSSARKAAREAIIEQEVAAYAEFQRRHPGASQEVLEAQFEACLRSARATYMATIADDAQSCVASSIVSATALQSATGAKHAVSKEKMRERSKRAVRSARQDASEAAAQASENARKETVRQQAEATASSARIEAQKIAAAHALVSVGSAAHTAATHEAQTLARQKAQAVSKTAALQAHADACKTAKQEATTQARVAVADRVKQASHAHAPAHAPAPQAEPSAPASQASDQPAGEASTGLEHIAWPRVPAKSPSPDEIEVRLRALRSREGRDRSTPLQPRLRNE